MLRSALFASLFLAPIFASAQGPAAAAPPDTPAYRSDPKFQKAVASTADPKSTPDDKLSAWKKAAKISGNTCTECARAITTLQIQSRDYKNALASAIQLQSIATTANDKYFASAEQGVALMHLNAKPKPADLTAADTAFRAALAIAPHSQEVLWSEGRVLAMLGKFDEAKETFSTYIANAKPRDPFLIRARHFQDDPHLAALPLAPPFTVHTAQGDSFSLDNMNGKVVLIDFWATWCGPCRETLPQLKKLAQKYADAPLVVISVSRDDDAKAWKEVIAKEGMTWPQYRDADDSLAKTYGVTSIPRFFTIDTDGVLAEAQLGSDTNIDGMVKRLVSKAIEAQKQKAATTQTQAVGQ